MPISSIRKYSVYAPTATSSAVRGKRPGATGRLVGLALALLLLPLVVPAASDDDIELEGIVVDRTISPWGGRFYREFAAVWLNLASRETRHANLVVRERPAIGFGSLLSVAYAGRVVFRAILTPRKTDTDQLAEDAARFIARRIVSIDLEQSGGLAGNVDLHGDGY